MHDVIIIGAGAAGQAAAITSKKLGLDVFVVAKEIKDLAEYPASDFVDNGQLTKLFEQNIAAAEIKQAKVTVLEKNVVSFSLEIESGEVLYSHSVIIATGKDGSGNFDGLTQKDLQGKIKINIHQHTSVLGIFAAGQVAESLTDDIVIVLGSGIKASISAKEFLEKKALK